MPLDSAIYAAGVVLPGPSSLPASTQMPSWTVAGAFAGWVSATSPAGVGTELQFKNGAAFGAVTGSSVSGGNVNLAGLLQVYKDVSTAKLHLAGHDLSTGDCTFLRLSYDPATTVYDFTVSRVGTNLVFASNQQDSGYKFISNSGYPGLFGINVTPSAQLHVVAYNPTIVGQIIAGAASQSASLANFIHGSNPGANANFLSCTSSGGVEGDKFSVTSTGAVFSAGIIGNPSLSTGFTAVAGTWDNKIFGNSSCLGWFRYSNGFQIPGDRPFSWSGDFSHADNGGTALGLIGDTTGTVQVTTGAFINAAGSNARDLMLRTLKGASVSGLNVAGPTIYIAPSQSTGNAPPASVVIQGTVAGASSSTAQTLVDVLKITDGKLWYGTHSGLTAETVTGYITIKDAGGVDRKLAVIS